MKPSSNQQIREQRSQSRREYAGSALLSGAFRPFFLAASVWAVAAIGLWLHMLSGANGGDFGGVHWHIHEMIFGFVGAALAGFILTAIPNWTGRLPVRGAPLGGLVLLWLFGRLGFLASGLFGVPWLSLLDIIFPVVLFFVVYREIVSAKNKRNLPVAVLFALFALANVLTHAEGYGVAGLDGHGWRLGLGVIVLLISVIGGRIVPSFTRNWLKNSNGEGGRLPAQSSTLDKSILGLVLASLLIWVLFPRHWGSGAMLIMAGIGQLARLSRWRGLATIQSSIVFVLHIGYGWVGLGLLLLGISILSDSFSSSAALHALTIGGIGTMIVAVMSRASLGHSGRAIKAGVGLNSVYILISLAVIMRLLSGVFPQMYLAFIYASGGLWIAAFGLFVILFLPLFFEPRSAGRG